MRLFIAIDISQDLKEKLSRLIAKLKKCDLDAKWVSSTNIHMTLKFLGETQEEQLAEIKNIITAVCVKFSRLELSINGFGFFPHEKSPRVFFISTDNEEILKSISLELEERLESLGFPKESRFRSHLTIARFRSKKNIDCLKKEIKNISIIAKFDVTEIILSKSTLTPQGPIYEKIFSAPLKIN
jgi:2'-5' RNA ligase